MNIGLQIWRFDWSGNPGNIRQRLKEIAQTAENSGFYSLWTMDHYFQMEMMGNPADPMMEAYTTLSYLGAVTERVKLGALVTGVIYREPAFLVKQVTALDVLSGGRAYLGIGAAWYEREAIGLGFNYPPTAERFEMLEETLQLVHHMWDAKTEPFESKHYTLKEPINNPPPLSKPHPPIMIGGMGKKKTLRYVAQYGNACNFFLMMGMNPVKEAVEVLKEHCEAVGRDYNEIEKTALGSIDFSNMSSEDVINQCKKLSELGFSHIIYNLPNYETMDDIEKIGKEIIPAVADL